MKINTHMSVAELLPYREYNRVLNPAPKVPFIQTYDMEEVVAWVSVNGVSEQKPLELSVFEDTALLTDGNHRVAAASILGIATVPVEITYYESKADLEHMFHQHTIDRFKKVA